MSERRPLLTSVAGQRVSWRRSRSQFGTPRAEPEYDTLEDSTLLASSSVGIRSHTIDRGVIDWLHDDVKEQLRKKRLRAIPGLRGRLARGWDALTGWVAVTLVAVLFSLVVDVLTRTEGWLFGLKEGYCESDWSKTKAGCCSNFSLEECPSFRTWSEVFTRSPLNDVWSVDYAALVVLGVIFAVFASTLTVYLTSSDSIVSEKDSLVSVAEADTKDEPVAPSAASPHRRVFYYAAGSGISEVKSILSGYVLRGFLGSSTLFVKTFGLAFSVASGLSLGKEGPFVHCACCVANLVTRFFRKYNHNEAKRREILSAACAAGVAAAFGAPAGGVLFSLEETSYYFGKLCLWRSFACSTITYAITRTLSPHANGKATMLETSFSRTYTYHEFAAFVVLGIIGGLYGAWFCASNIAWSRNVRSKTFLGRHPIGEVALIALLTLLVQYWNPFTALEGPRLLSELFSECLPDDERFLCYRNRTDALAVLKSLGIGFLIKALLTVVTFGIKIPAGVFIPTLAAGALAGRALAIIVHLVALADGEWALLGQCQYSSVTCILPARWALLGATAALVGVTRSTVSLAVIVIELTGTLSESLPILVVTVFAKLTADAFNKLSIYELVIQMNGLPYLEPSLDLGDLTPCDIADLYAPCIHTDADNTIGSLRKLLKRCSGRVAGFPILRNTEEGKRVVGYIALQDLALGLTQIGTTDPDTPCMFRPPSTGGFYSGLSTPSSCNLGNLMDSSPLLVTMRSPTELLQELFVKLGTRCCMVTDDNSCYVGVIEKDRWIAYLEWTQGKQESPFGHDL